MTRRLLIRSLSIVACWAMTAMLFAQSPAPVVEDDPTTPATTPTSIPEATPEGEGESVSPSRRGEPVVTPPPILVPTPAPTPATVIHDQSTPPIPAPVVDTGSTTPAASLTTATATATTTATATDTQVTSPSTPPLHIGRLTPANEAAAIVRHMDALTTVPGTDLLIGYRLSPPAGWYQLEGTTLVWHEPSPADTHKLTITVQDAADLRIIPYSKVTASFAGPTGGAGQTTHTLNFLWDPEYYSYGLNISLPEDARSVDLHVKVEAPTFRRRDQVLGAFFAHSVSHTFSGIIVPASVKPEPSPGVPTTRGLFPKGRRPYAEPTPYPGQGKGERQL